MLIHVLCDAFMEIMKLFEAIISNYNYISFPKHAKSMTVWLLLCVIHSKGLCKVYSKDVQNWFSGMTFLNLPSQHEWKLVTTHGDLRPL